MLVATAVLVPLWVMADAEQASFTATLYSDMIRFEADSVASLHLTIYDLAENELWTSGLIPGGFVDWDRTNTAGERLANGYYLYLAQGWDAAESLVLDKAGKVVLLPGNQVELKAAPTVSGVPTDSREEPIFAPMAYDATNYYISNTLGVGTDTPAYPVDVAGYVRSEKLMCTSTSPQMRWYESDAADDPNDYVRHEYGGNKYRMQWRDDSAGTWFNALTADGTNRFVGIGTTTPSQELDVVGDINWSGSLYHGGNLLLHFSGVDSTFFGHDAGTTASTGSGSTAFGNKALRDNTNGLGNTAFGRSALRQNTSGDANTAVGEAALLNNNGSSNTAVGNDALIVNTSGSKNVAIGDDAMYFNSTGDGNTAVGYWALEDSLGNNNTAIGYDAIKNLSSGNLNTGVGHNALVSLTSGSNNIALGNSAGQNCSTGSYNIHIGNGAVSESNTTRIGDANQTRTFISGIWNVAIGGGAQVVVDSNGQLGNAGVSSRVFKRDIADVGDRANLLYNLRPVTFRYNEDIDPIGITQYGLIAEEVAEVAPELVLTDDQGNPQIVRYELLAPLLLSELQAKDAEVTAQYDRLDTLQAQVDDLLRTQADLLARLEALEAAD